MSFTQKQPAKETVLDPKLSPREDGTAVTRFSAPIVKALQKAGMVDNMRLLLSNPDVEIECGFCHMVRMYLLLPAEKLKGRPNFCANCGARFD